MRVYNRTLRILDFDIENRPLSYWVPDRPTAEVTAIAAGWADKSLSQVDARLLGEVSLVDMLTWFAELYQQADMVTGHYIREHDLPILNGAMLEVGMPSLAPKLVCDTKIDLIGWKDIPKTQEHLADMFGVRAPKVPMSQSKWREANRLTTKGLELTYKRVVGDVRQHMQLRKALIGQGLLRPPRVWKP